jgi:hypothetical protein
MVTAPAPALPDSHALPQAAVGAASNSSQTPSSFQTVYQSLPAFAGDSQNALISKASSAKKLSPKVAQDNLAAVVGTGTIDPSPTRPLTPSLRSFSLTGREAGTATEPAANEVAQLSPGIQSAVQFGANAFPADLKSSAKLASNPDVRSGIQLAEQAPVSNPVNSANRPTDASAIATSANQLAVRRATALNSQATAAAPSFSFGAPALPAIPEVSSPDPAEPANPTRPSRAAGSASSQAAVDPALFTKGLAAALAPRQDNLAFSLKMAETNSTARRAQQATQSEPADRNGISAQPKSQERTPAFTLQASTPHATAAPSTVTGEVAAVASTMNQAWNVVAATPQSEIRPEQFSEPREAADLSTVAAMHEAQQILPETARPTAAAEIMLQLGGKDQAAAIRVTERAGTVNVSVHTADADLRSSLRSNLGDLASQLSHQGWKTEVVKTGTVLTRAETSQDPQQSGQRSPNQQQPSSQGDRQPQRDRRSNSGQWLAEFEEQASGNSGGTN